MFALFIGINTHKNRCIASAFRNLDASNGKKNFLGKIQFFLKKSRENITQNRFQSFLFPYLHHWSSSFSSKIKRVSPLSRVCLVSTRRPHSEGEVISRTFILFC